VTTGVETFFRSRWATPPDSVAELEPTRLAAGFRAAAVATGSKPSGRLDVGVLVCEHDDAASAAIFTTNTVAGAPVEVSRRAQVERLRAVVVNAGNANVGTGARGIEVAEAMVAQVASAIAVEPGRVGVASTGVIAVQLERERILAGITRAAEGLSPDGGADFSEAIMTSDRGPKRACLELTLSGGPVVVSAQCKGAGMISPAFATMLCFVETDAAIDAATLDRVVRRAAAQSFDRITVDGQLSTSDSLFAFASGASACEVAAGSGDEQLFAAALGALFRQLAVEIVSDGEGASRVARLVVRGPAGNVEPVGRAVANSPLVKCALHGADPNWGRILQAAGQAGGGPALDLTIEGVPVVRGGSDLPLGDGERRRLDDSMRGSEVELELSIPGGDAEAELFFCDLSEDYVRFNSEYTT
jgi:glutamate N-acetyltransferase/amino-acid N-acetyltransferase